MVIGLGVIGCELGQAINRLGVKVIGVTRNKRLGGLTDPKIQDYFAEKLSKEFPIHYSGANLVGVSDSGLLKLEADGKTYEVEKAILSLGRRPNIDNLGLEKLNLELNEWGVPIVDPSTMQIKGAEHLFLPGDVNGDRPILHEAADEGKIAGLNASQEVKNYQRRTALGITFCDPNIASVGLGWTSLNESNIKFEVGEVSFEGQGRSIVKLKEQGMLRVYGEKSSGRLLGAEMHGPDAEHIAHLLAWVISLNLNVTEVLRMPFYHPVIEEGLRTALRDLAFKLSDNPEEELLST